MVNICKLHFINGLKCTRGASCTFSHKLFPRDYSAADRIVLNNFVKATLSLSWGPKVLAALDRLEVRQFLFLLRFQHHLDSRSFPSFSSVYHLQQTHNSIVYTLIFLHNKNTPNYYFFAKKYKKSCS